MLFEVAFCAGFLLSFAFFWSAAHGLQCRDHRSFLHEVVFPMTMYCPSLGGTTIFLWPNTGVVLPFPLLCRDGASVSQTDAILYGRFAAPHWATVWMRWVHHPCDAPAEGKLRWHERDRMNGRSCLEEDGFGQGFSILTVRKTGSSR